MEIKYSSPYPDDEEYMSIGSSYPGDDDDEDYTKDNERLAKLEEDIKDMENELRVKIHEIFGCKYRDQKGISVYKDGVYKFTISIK